MVVRLFYIAVLLALMTILPFFPSARMSAEETPSLAKAPKPKELKEVRGKIVKIDPATRRLRVVPGIFSRSKEIKVTSRTEITIHGRPAMFSDLQAGNRVKIQSLGSEEDQTAESIDVL